MIYVITGPTGSGKTKLSIALAKKLNAEIINADAMQIYKGLDIATAKIKEEEKEGIKHHLLDIREKEEDYSVYDYQKDARKCIEEITARGKNIILVGGTGLYIKATLYDYQFQKEEKPLNLTHMSDEELYQKALSIDNNLTIHKNNRRRLERFLTNVENNSLSKNKDQCLYPFLALGLTTSREILYEKIDKRVDIMVEEGLLEEAKAIYDSKIRSKAITTAIGYKELFPYFEGEISLEEALNTIKKNSRHYAKRQYTFFNHQLPITWIETNYDDFEKTIHQALTIVKNQE